MEWHNEVAAELPPANEDEPKSLRRDILDELTDHLTCSAQRERIQEDDEETVRQTILARFGDPARVARRLWFDAMKGKLMLQKLTAAFAATGALAAIVVCFVLWSAVNGATSAFEMAVAQSREDRNQNRKDREEDRKDRQRAEKANAALLAKLEAMAVDARKNSFRSLEWNPLKFKLLLGQNGERPATGYEIELSGQPYKGGEKESLRKQSDANGVVDFGRVRPGNYKATVSTPWSAWKYVAIHVAPGSEVTKTVRCPETKVVGAEVELAIDLPDDLAKRNCRVVARIRGPRQSFGDTYWLIPDRHTGTEFELSPTDTIRVFTGWERKIRSINQQQMFGFLGTVPDRVQMASSNAGSAYAWRTAEYRIELMALLLPFDHPGPGTDQMYVVDAISYGLPRFPEDSNALLSNEYPVFMPQAGKKNVWKISLPPRLLANARERLKKYDAERKAAKKTKPAKT